MRLAHQDDFCTLMLQQLQTKIEMFLHPLGLETTTIENEPVERKLSTICRYCLTEYRFIWEQETFSVL